MNSNCIVDRLSWPLLLAALGSLVFYTGAYSIVWMPVGFALLALFFKLNSTQLVQPGLGLRSFLLGGAAAVIGVHVALSPAPWMSVSQVLPLVLATGGALLFSTLPRNWARRMPYFLAIVLTPVVGYGIYQYFKLPMFAKAHFNDSNLFGALAYTLTALAAGLYVQRQQQGKRKAIFILLGAIGVMGLWGATSRSAWLAATATVALVGFWLAPRFAWKKLLITGLVVALGALGYINTAAKTAVDVKVAKSVAATPAAEPQPVESGAHSVESRKAMLQSSMAMAKDHPVLGVGIGLWSNAYLSYRLPADTDSSGDYAHNDYIELLASAGPTGLLAVLMPLIVVLSAFRRDQAVEASPDRAMAITLLGIALALTLHAAVNFIFTIMVGGLLLGACLGIGLRLAHADETEVSLSPVKSRAWTAVALLLAGPVLAIGMLAHISAKNLLDRYFPYAPYMGWLQNEPALELLHNIVPFEHSPAYAIGVLNLIYAEQAKTPEERKDAIARSNLWLDKAYARAPLEKTIWAHRAELAMLSEGEQAVKEAKALELLKKSLADNPTYQKALVMLTKIYLSQGHGEEAIPFIINAINHANKFQRQAIHPLLGLVQSQLKASPEQLAH